jgi:hypothetical protein
MIQLNFFPGVKFLKSAFRNHRQYILKREGYLMATNKTQLLMTVSQESISSVFNDEAQESDIAIAAYYRAQDSEFVPVNKLQDWLIAEQEENTI